MRKHVSPDGAKRTLQALLATAFLVFYPMASVQPSKAGDDEGMCQAPNAYDIKVKVENLRSLQGLLTVELYNDDPDGFIKKSGRLQRVRLSVKESGQVACLKAPGPGTYAVVLYHDENANRKFDKGWFGIPIEGFGISRNPKIGFGVPDLDEAAFELGKDPVTLEIRMNYL